MAVRHRRRKAGLTTGQRQWDKRQRQIARDKAFAETKLRLKKLDPDKKFGSK